MTTEQGVPVLAETVVFLNTQCSSTYIRALGKCLSPQEALSSPLKRLLQLAKHLKAFRLQQVLVESLPACDETGLDA